MCKRLALHGKLSPFSLVVCRYLLSVVVMHLQGIKLKENPKYQHLVRNMFYVWKFR